MPDVRKCSIYGCRSNSRDHKDLKFFNFPARDSPSYSNWISLCHESADILRSIRRPYICSSHFYPRDVGYRRLAIGAMPALRLKAPPGFAEEERAREEEEAAAQIEKANLIKLINDCLFEWVKRAQNHQDIDSELCTTRRELQRVGAEIRNLLGATLTCKIDDYWLKKFRRSHMQDWDYLRDLNNDQQIIQSLDLIEIIKSIDPSARIFNKEEIAILAKEEKLAQQISHSKRLGNQLQTPDVFTDVKAKYHNSKNRSVVEASTMSNYQTKRPIKIEEDISAEQKFQPNKTFPQMAKSSRKRNFDDTFTKKKSHHDTLDEYYDTNSDKIKTEKMDELSYELDEDSFDDCSDDSQSKMDSETVVENYQQALQHLKPLEDFALRHENYRVIGLLSTLESIFTNPRKT